MGENKVLATIALLKDKLATHIEKLLADKKTMTQDDITHIGFLAQAISILTNDELKRMQEELKTLTRIKDDCIAENFNLKNENKELRVKANQLLEKEK